MFNFRLPDYRIWLTLIVSVAFSAVFIQILPVLASKPLYLLAFPLIAIFFIALLLKPLHVLIGLFLSRPLLDNFLNLTKVSVGGGDGLSIGAALNLGMIILGVFLFFYYGKFPSKDKTVRYWLIFLVLMLISVLYSPMKFGAIRLYFNYLSYFAMFLMPFFIIQNRKDFAFWLKIFAWSFVLPIVAANIDLLKGGHYFADAGMRVAGTFTHPNILAFYLLLGIVVYFYILKSKLLNLRKGMVWIFNILILNMVILLIATKTRNAWIAGFSVFFIYGLLKDKRILLALLFLIPVSLLVPQVQERMQTVFTTKAGGYEGINSMEWRLRMWKSSLPLIAQRPLQGYGLTSFKPMSASFSDVGRNMGAHNAYLEVLFETGIIGLLSFMALFLSPLLLFFKNMKRSADNNSAKLWALNVGYVISYLIICSADNLSYYLVFNWYVWFFIGLMIVSQRFQPELQLEKK